MFRSLALLVVLLLTPASGAFAASYYVSPSGNDGNNGSSQAEAWRTISHAARSLLPGDVVYVYDGDYQSEFVQIELTGTSSNPIRFQAAPGAAPIVSGFRLRNAGWIEISGFRVKGPKVFPSNWKDPPEVVIDDPSVGYIDPREDSSTRSLKVEQKFKTYMDLKRQMESSYTSGIDIESGAQNIEIRNNEISHHSIGINMRRGASQINIEDNYVHHCRTGIWTYDSSGPSAVDVAIRGNQVRYSLTGAIDIRESANRVVVEDNRVEFNCTSHIGFRRSSTNGIIRKNYVAYGGYYAEAMTNPGSSAINIHTLGPNANVLVEQNFAAYQLEPTWDSNGIIIDIAPGFRNDCAKQCLLSQHGGRDYFHQESEVIHLQQHFS